MIMKRILILILFSFFSTVVAQESANRFKEGEDEATYQKANVIDHSTGTDNSQSKTGNPADPVPIDDYIPLLIFAAVGIIIYQTQEKKNLLS